MREPRRKRKLRKIWQKMMYHKSITIDYSYFVKILTNCSCYTKNSLNISSKSWEIRDKMRKKLFCITTHLISPVECCTFLLPILFSLLKNMFLFHSSILLLPLTHWMLHQTVLSDGRVYHDAKTVRRCQLSQCPAYYETTTIIGSRMLVCWGRVRVQYHNSCKMKLRSCGVPSDHTVWQKQIIFAVASVHMVWHGIMEKSLKICLGFSVNHDLVT